MTPRELKRAGRKLFGNDWQSPLARQLKVHRITVWRWLSGRTPIPADKAIAIREMAS